MYDMGLKITINTDDLLIFDSSIENEYLLLYNAQVLTAEQLDDIRISGLNSRRQIRTCKLIVEKNIMITFKEVDKSFFELYDKVSMNVNVQSEYEVKRINGGLGGLVFEEVPVEPYIKDLSIYERAIEYEKEFDITNWRFYMAFDD